MPSLNDVHYVKFIRGSVNAWQTLLQTPNKIDNDTLYFIYENVQNPTEGQLYLGQKLISGNGSSNVVSINNIGDVYINDETIADYQLLVYNETSQQWTNASLNDILSNEIGDFVGASANAAGAAGLVPAPQIGDQNKFLRGDKSWAEIVTPSFDGNLFSVTNNVVTFKGFANAPVGSIPVKSASGITWSQQGSGTLKRQIISLENLQVAILNNTADENTIYMVLIDSPEDNTNHYDEYMVINSSLERLGTFGEVSLDNYVTKTSFETFQGNLNTLLQGYVTKVAVGDLSLLNLTGNNTNLVEEMNSMNDTIGDLSERLQWRELDNN